MFFFRASVMKAAIAEHLPALAAGLDEIDEAAARGDEARVLGEVFPTLPSISDRPRRHGEGQAHRRRARRLRLERRRKLAGHMGDVREGRGRQRAARRAPSRSTRSDNLVRDLTTAARTAPKRWALVGVSDLVVVETDDAVLIVPRDRAQDVRAVVDALAARGETDRYMMRSTMKSPSPSPSERPGIFSLRTNGSNRQGMNFGSIGGPSLCTQSCTRARFPRA